MDLVCAIEVDAIKQNSNALKSDRIFVSPNELTQVVVSTIGSAKSPLALRYGSAARCLLRVSDEPNSRVAPSAYRGIRDCRSGVFKHLKRSDGSQAVVNLIPTRHPVGAPRSSPHHNPPHRAKPFQCLSRARGIPNGGSAWRW